MRWGTSTLDGEPDHIYPHSGYLHETGRGAGTGYTRNVALSLECSGEDWLRQFESNLSDCERKFSLDYLLVGAGFDAHREDPFGVMRVEDRHFLKAVRRLKRGGLYAGGELVPLRHFDAATVMDLAEQRGLTFLVGAPVTLAAPLERAVCIKFRNYSAKYSKKVLDTFFCDFIDFSTRFHPCVHYGHRRPNY